MLVYAGYFLAFLGLVFLALALYIWRQGDADFIFDTAKRSRLVLEKETKNEMVFSFSVPFRNRGSQQGITKTFDFIIVTTEESLLHIRWHLCVHFG